MTIRVVNKRTGGTGEYVGRPSPLGNPYKIGPDGDRDAVVEKYKKWLIKHLFNATEEHRAVHAEINRLHNLHAAKGDLNLVCWCAPKRCHADMIKGVLDLMMEETLLEAQKDFRK